MKVTVSPGTLGGTIPAIASKSCAHRLLICAALSGAPSELGCSTVSDDILATARCLEALGAGIERTDGGFSVSPIDREKLPSGPVLDCGESGSTLRFLLPVVCALGADCRLEMGGRLPQRPLSPLYEELVRHGARLSAQGVSPLRTGGKLEDPAFVIPGGVSSQFISGLLLALPIMGGGTVKVTGKTESRSYIDITCRCMTACGADVRFADGVYAVSGGYAAPKVIAAEGDWSNAAFWLCAGAIGKNAVTVTGLDPDSAQGDRKIVDIIRKFHGNVMVTKSGVTSIPAKLRGTEIDAADIPDLVPVISTLAAAAEGTTRVYDAGRLRLKESDRLAAISNVMSTLGVNITETTDGFTIVGGAPLRGGEVSAWSDHRIAMTAAVASLLADGPVTIDGAECAAKSYPGFFEDFRRLGGEAT
jgi:3-phosphoshikimate 1-carboxyvinyltransferase